MQQDNVIGPHLFQDFPGQPPNASVAAVVGAAGEVDAVQSQFPQRGGQLGTGYAYGWAEGEGGNAEAGKLGLGGCDFSIQCFGRAQH